MSTEEAKVSSPKNKLKEPITGGSGLGTDTISSSTWVALGITLGLIILVLLGIYLTHS